jgi:putative transposase
LGGRTPLQQWEIDHEERNLPLRSAPSTSQQRGAFGVELARKVRKGGVIVLGVRYNSWELAAQFVFDGAFNARVRFDGQNMGAIAVCAGSEWLTVPAVHDGLEGLNVREWTTTRRALRAQSEYRKAWDEETVLTAIKHIKAIGNRRALEFNIIDMMMDKKQLDEPEKSLFQSFQMVDSKPITTAALDDFGGETISPERPDIYKGDPLDDDQPSFGPSGANGWRACDD